MQDRHGGRRTRRVQKQTDTHTVPCMPGHSRTLRKGQSLQQNVLRQQGIHMGRKKKLDSSSQHTKISSRETLSWPKCGKQNKKLLEENKEYLHNLMEERDFLTSTHTPTLKKWIHWIALKWRLSVDQDALKRVKSSPQWEKILVTRITNNRLIPSLSTELLHINKEEAGQIEADRKMSKTLELHTEDFPMVNKCMKILNSMKNLGMWNDNSKSPQEQLSRRRPASLSAREDVGEPEPFCSVGASVNWSNSSC